MVLCFKISKSFIYVDDANMHRFFIFNCTLNQECITYSPEIRKFMNPY